MATTQTNVGLDVIMDACRTYFHQRQNERREASQRRKIYRQTVFELSNLTNRDLRDLGIPRCNIKRIAMEAAYGC